LLFICLFVPRRSISSQHLPHRLHLPPILCRAGNICRKDCTTRLSKSINEIIKRFNKIIIYTLMIPSQADRAQEQ